MSVIYYLNTLNALVSTAVHHSTLKVYYLLIKQIFPAFFFFKKLLLPLFHLFVPIFLWFAVSQTGGWEVPPKLANPINLSGILSPLFSISYLYVAKNMLPGLSFFPRLVVFFFSPPPTKKWRPKRIYLGDPSDKDNEPRWEETVVSDRGGANAAAPCRPQASAWRQSHVTGARAAPPAGVDSRCPAREPCPGCTVESLSVPRLRLVWTSSGPSGSWEVPPSRNRSDGNRSGQLLSVCGKRSRTISLCTDVLLLNGAAELTSSWRAVCPEARANGLLTPRQALGLQVVLHCGAALINSYKSWRDKCWTAADAPNSHSPANPPRARSWELHRRDSTL